LKREVEGKAKQGTGEGLRIVPFTSGQREPNYEGQEEQDLLERKAKEKGFQSFSSWVKTAKTSFSTPLLTRTHKSTCISRRFCPSVSSRRYDCQSGPGKGKLENESVKTG